MANIHATYRSSLYGFVGSISKKEILVKTEETMLRVRVTSFR